jgi:hypothetical protein
LGVSAHKMLTILNPFELFTKSVNFTVCVWGYHSPSTAYGRESVEQPCRRMWHRAPRPQARPPEPLQLKTVWGIHWNKFARPWPRACQITDYVLLTFIFSILPNKFAKTKTEIETKWNRFPKKSSSSNNS